MILITGATGNIGRPLLRELARAGAKVRALVREGATNVEGAETVAGDLGKPETLPAALDGVETAFLLTPVSQEQVAWKSNLIRAAREAGVKRIVNLSVAGAAPDSPLILGRWHCESEKELEASGLAWTHLRPYDLARYNTHLFLSTARVSRARFIPRSAKGRWRWWMKAMWRPWRRRFRHGWWISSTTSAAVSATEAPHGSARMSNA